MIFSFMGDSERCSFKYVALFHIVYSFVFPRHKGSFPPPSSLSSPAFVPFDGFATTTKSGKK